MNWSVGNWLGVAVLAAAIALFLLVIVISDTFKGWRLHHLRRNRDHEFYWGPGDPPWKQPADGETL